MERARAATLATDPGTKYSYTNTNYHLAARLMEVVAAQPFHDYLRQHILEPLGMHASRTIDSAPDDIPDGHIYAYGAYQLLLPSGQGIAVMSNSGIGLGNEGTAELANGLAELIEGGTPAAPGPTRLIVDLVLAGLTLFSLALGVRTLRRTGRWAQRMSGRPTWLVVLRLAPRLIPLGLLLTLPDLLGLLVSGGRDLTHVQLAHYSLPLVIWSIVASAMGVAVLITRTRALVKS